jgi:ubiquinone/menaquinone biosynthesis C-methylase UbiE
VTRQDVAWQGEAAVRWFLDSVRGAIPFAAEQVAIMLRMVERGPVPVRRFLDVGAGDGVLSAALLSRFPRAEPVLVDFSPLMLEAARERLAPLTARAVVLRTDLATPGWRDAVADYAPFDAIVSGLAIHHLEDARKRALYGELYELLRPGGAFAHIEHVAAESEWMSQAFDEAMIDAIWAHGRRANPSLARDEAAATYEGRPDRAANRLAPLATQLAWLGEAGFAEVAAPFRWYELAIFGGYRPQR